MTTATKLVAPYVVLATLFAAQMTPLPSAVASPVCDWHTDEGNQACLGGGPFGAGKNGQGDTYGPSGEAGFVNDNQRSFPRLNSDGLLKLGRAICHDKANGLSDKTIESELTSHGVTQGNAGAVVESAEMFLCPSR